MERESGDCRRRVSAEDLRRRSRFEGKKSMLSNAFIYASLTNPCIKCFFLTKYHVGAGAKVSWCSSETHEDPDLGSSFHSGSQEDPAWYFQVPVAGGPRLRLRGGPALWGESDPQL